MLPAYQKVTSFLREMGVKIILVDTDGNIQKLVPLFMESGITAIFPFEIQAGNDILSFRRKYPRLQILGGIDKMKIALGKAAIDEELNSKIPFMLKAGGFVPHVDHQVHPEISWGEFQVLPRPPQRDDPWRISIMEPIKGDNKNSPACA